MHRTLTFGLALFLKAAFAQTPLPDSQATQSVLTEIRQLRHDLQTMAATIQRVQIVMYRLQAEAALSDRATQRLDQARAGCSQGQMRRKGLAAQIEQAETRKRNAQNPSDQKAAEEMLSNLKASAEMWASQEQECQVEQSEAESQFRAEQAKMTDLQAQLEKLDRLLAGSGSQ
jgi:chromosome segregation ATPase